MSGEKEVVGIKGLAFVGSLCYKLSMKKSKPKIDPRISEHYRNLANKGVEARHAKILAKNTTRINLPVKGVINT